MRFRPSVFVPLLGAALAASPARAQEPNFGRALALTADELLVGQPLNWYGPGTVYTYRLDGGGAWRERSRLTAPDSARMDGFGQALAVAGNTLAVGAPRQRDDAGAAYVFTRTGPAAPWREPAVVAAPNGGGFGHALALAGDELLVGAPREGTGGAVHAFVRRGTAWVAGAALLPAGDKVAGFGAALSRDGDWLLVGAPASDSGAGAAFVVRRGADGTWGAPQALEVPAERRAGVGAAVLLEGRRAYVGAPGAGAVHVFERGADDRWSPAGGLQPFDVPRRSRFGSAIAVAGGEVWIGAPGVNRANGAVYRFTRDDAGFRSAVRFDADSADGTSWPFMFGASIASAGERAVVGMPFRDFGEGRVLAVASRGGAWRPQQVLTGEIRVLGGGPAAPGKCVDGANGVYTCRDVEVVAHLPTSALGGARGAWVNDVWGWTDEARGRDYALVARRDGASFVDVTDPAHPRLVGTLPRTAGAPPSVWRDIKVLGHHAYIVADGAAEHGMQVFDLTRLRDVTGAPVTFAPDTTYHEIASAHNVVADTASGFLYVVGANGGGTTCGGGLHMVDAREPGRPVFAGCYHNPGGKSRGYTHDAQCVVYRGPDVEHRGRQVCVGSNESEINIADVTDKAAPRLLGRASYPNVSYAHQGWFDDEQRYFYMNDENDELAGLVEGTRTIVWDLTDLDDPVVANMYIGPVRSSDHNLFVVGNRVYESNYGSGLRVLDISDRTHPREVAYFDSAPLNDDGPGHSADQSGAWSNYPFFRSGVVVFTSVREGLFIVKVTETPGTP